MRWLFPLAGIVIATFSLLMDWRQVTPDSRMCRAGLCRFDQIFAAPTKGGELLNDMAALVNEDPSNPMVWSTYAELLSARGQVAEATAAFEHAVSLGPGMAPVLVRAAHFDFSQGRQDQGLQVANRILRQTDAFDQDLFQALAHSGADIPTLLRVAVPATPRAARSWLAFVGVHGSDQDLLQTWNWMKQKGLTDQKLALDLTWTLWQKKSFYAAREVWADWSGRGRALTPERLANSKFQNAPDGSPFDWTMASVPSVEISRQNGLEVHFSGEDNVDFAQVRQFVTVKPGRYRLAAEISANGITTVEGPFWHAFDAANPARLSALTPQAKGSFTRSWVTSDFQVPPGTEVLQIQLERHPVSQRFDTKIAGSLHVYQVSLVTLP